MQSLGDNLHECPILFSVKKKKKKKKKKNQKNISNSCLLTFPCMLSASKFIIIRENNNTKKFTIVKDYHNKQFLFKFPNKSVHDVVGFSRKYSLALTLRLDDVQDLDDVAPLGFQESCQPATFVVVPHRYQLMKTFCI